MALLYVAICIGIVLIWIVSEKDFPVNANKSILQTYPSGLRWRIDMQIAAESQLTSSATTDESKIVEFGDLVLHDGGAIPQLAAAVLVVARSNGNYSTIADLVERYDLECCWKRLVRSPVRRQRAAQDNGAARLYQVVALDFESILEHPVHLWRIFRQMHRYC